MAKFERTSTLPPIDTKAAQLGIGVDAIKIGMLGSSEVIRAVAQTLVT